MRDLLFVITFVILIYYCFKKPYIGITLWLWISLFYPKGWVYGFAENIRYNLIIVVITIFSYILHKDKDPKNFGSLSWLILIFLLWTTISSIFTISTPSLVWAEWFEFFKICLLYFFAIATIRTKNHLDTLIWGVALSLGVFSSLQGARFILSGGGHILSGMGGHTLGDRNDLSVAIILMIPLLVYLAHTTKQKIIKLSLFAMIILSVTAVLGSGSRGGFIGVSIVAAYFWINSNHKIISLALLLILGVVTIGFMPDSWHDRMSTIESAIAFNALRTSVDTSPET